MTTAEQAREDAEREGFLRRSAETILAVLLGLVSIGVAWASFQASLYDGQVTQFNTLGTNQATEAESFYLEGNQQYVQDAQLFDNLTNLALDAQNPDPAIAAAAQIKYDTIFFQSVSEEFGAAIQWADEQNASDPDLWYSPLDNEDYQAFLFGGYDETKTLSDTTLEKAANADKLGDKLTLYTVLMALALFLLGIGAVVKEFRVKVILGSVAVAIFVVSGVLTLLVPFLWIE
jgi:hypothetical protein